jgi:hypothetical protein
MDFKYHARFGTAYLDRTAEGVAVVQTGVHGSNVRRAASGAL